jgi:hypothetical protein
MLKRLGHKGAKKSITTPKILFMKMQFRYLSVAVLSAAILFTSCKKDKTSTIDDTTEYKVQADDQSRFSNETDAAANDANTAVENIGGTYNGDTPLTPLLPSICDATVTVDTVSVPRKLTITYNGNNCAGTRTRTGVVTVSFAPNFRWNQAGAQYTVKYENLKITRLSDNKSITINGEKTVTNVSGGRLRNLATRGSAIIHTIKSSNMNVTFDDGTTRTWQLARQRSFTYDGGIVLTITGIAPQGNGIAEWGTNRNGNTFSSAITQPLVIKQTCNFRLVSGQVTHTGLVVTVTTTFGLDAAGIAISACPSGSFYYKVVWTGIGGNSYTYIAPY